MGLINDNGVWRTEKEYHDRRWFQYIAPVFAVGGFIIGGVFLAGLIGDSTPFMIGGVVLGIILSIILRKLLTVIGYLIVFGVIGYMIFENL